jgi:F-type H+-transporting ATPase subunit b
MEGEEHLAEGAHGAAAAHGAEGAATFPPFDATLFPHQLFWFTLSFIALYLVLSKVAIPRIAEVLAARAKAVKTDLDAAATASESAEQTRLAAEQGAASGKAKAVAMIEEARAAAQAEFAAEQAKVDKRLSERAAAAEKKIGQTREKAMGEIGPVAADVAKDIAARVSGGVVGAA